MTRPLPPYLQIVARDGVENANSCHVQAFKFDRLETIGSYDIEKLFLRVMRFLCMGFATGSMRGLDNAHSVAEGSIGMGEDPGLVARTTAFLRAMRAERQAPFGYMNAGCPTCEQRITSQERQIIELIRAARSGEPRVVAAMAAAFAEAAEAPNCAAAALELAGLMQPYALAQDARRLACVHGSSHPAT